MLLPREKDEHVSPRSLPEPSAARRIQLAYRLKNPFRKRKLLDVLWRVTQPVIRVLRRVAVPRSDKRPITNFHRIASTRDFDHRGTAEEVRELPWIDGGRGHDQTQIRTLRKQLLQHAQEQIDVETALMRLIDDQRVVATQLPIAFELLEQDAVGHQLHTAVRARPIVEAHLVTDGTPAPDLRTGLLREPVGERTRRDSSRLRVPDDTSQPAPGLQTQLGKLRRLAGAGGSTENDDGMAPDRLDHFSPVSRDRQRRIIFKLERGPDVLGRASGLNLHRWIVPCRWGFKGLQGTCVYNPRRSWSRCLTAARKPATRCAVTTAATGAAKRKASGGGLS